jgi:hypothetical protein
MKNIKKLCFLILSLTTLFSCSYEPEIGSKITIYPVLTINGDQTVVITKGSTYTDLGAVALAGTENLPVTKIGTVDANTIGFYKITYEAFNSDGFSVAKTRTVVVLSASPSTIDLSGNWFRNGTNKNVITRISDRVYQCDNATGYITGNPNNLSLKFYNLDDTKIYAPYQENASSTGISAESNIGTITASNKFNWVIYASGFFGTAVRNFVR